MKLNVPVAPYYSGYSFFHGFDIPLRVIHVENGRAYPDHSHDFDEIAIIYEGEGSHFLNETEYIIHRGDMFFIRKGQHHKYENPKDLDYINILFDEKVLSDGDISEILRGLPSSGTRLNPIERANAASIINRMDRELYDQKPAYTQMARIYLMQLICLLYRAGTGSTGPDETAPKARIKNIIRYLDVENGPNIPIESLANEAGTCKRNFHRIFRQQTGMPPLEYINKLRIRKACELLANTDKTITSIAAIVNYTDSNYFTRQFRTVTGKTPTAYRKDIGPANRK